MKLIYKSLLLFIGCAVTLASCLKTNDLYEGFGSIKPIADIPLSRLSSDTLTVYGLAVAPSTSATVDTAFAVHLSSKNHVGNVTFKLGLGTSDPAFIKFMKDHPEYTLLPANLYSFDSAVTIQDAGVLNVGKVPIKFKTGSVDGNGDNLFLSNQYVLPIIIKDAGGYEIASNFRMIIMSVQAKNKYDGLYKTTGTMIDYSSAGLTGPYPWNTALVTNSASQVLVMDLDYTKDIFHKILSGGSSSYYGAFGVVINLDPVTNKVTSVVNYYGQPASNGRSAELDPSGVNAYDPATKTLKVKYWMNQPSVITPHRTSFDETYEYIGSR